MSSNLTVLRTAFDLLQVWQRSLIHLYLASVASLTLIQELGLSCNLLPHVACEYRNSPTWLVGCFCLGGGHQIGLNFCFIHQPAMERKKPATIWSWQSQRKRYSFTASPALTKPHSGSEKPRELSALNLLAFMKMKQQRAGWEILRA